MLGLRLGIELGDADTLGIPDGGKDGAIELDGDPEGDMVGQSLTLGSIDG